MEEEGWVRRFCCKEPKLSEYVKLYESLGFKVKLEPVKEDDYECGVCFEAERDKYRIIYTKSC